MNWRDINYLRDGTRRQIEAYHTLRSLSLISRLSPFDPILVSTVSLDIDVPSSDLNVICEVYDFEFFECTLHRFYSCFPDYTVKEKSVGNARSIVVRFHAPLFEIEIFGTPHPCETQDAYRHLRTFARVLGICGDPLREHIRELKARGMKTEPAFAYFFRLEGDPYQSVFELDAISDSQLRDLFIDVSSQFSSHSSNRASLALSQNCYQDYSLRG